MYCVSRKESLAKALISDGVSGGKWCVFHQESKWFGKAISGNKINVCEGMSHVLGQVSHWDDGGNW